MADTFLTVSVVRSVMPDDDLQLALSDFQWVDGEHEDEVVKEYELIPEDQKKQLRFHVAEVFNRDTQHQYKVVRKVAMFYFLEKGGEPALCRDGSKIRENLTDSYIRRATLDAAKVLDIKQSTVEGSCWGDRENYTKAQFFQELEEVYSRMKIRLG